MGINGTLTGPQIDILSTVYIALLTPSVIGSVSVLLVSIVRWRNLREQVHLLVQLSLADLLAALTLMTTSIMNKINVSQSMLICSYSLPLSLTFYLVSFLLVVVYAWKSKNALRGWRERPAGDETGQNQCSRKIHGLHLFLFVWLVPLSIYCCYVITPFIKNLLHFPVSSRNIIVPEQVTYCTSCILFLHVWKDSCSDKERIHDIFIRIFLFVVVIPVIITCTVIYYKVGQWYVTQKEAGLLPVAGDKRSRKRYNEVFSTTRNRVMVILLCWSPALVLILLSTLMIFSTIHQQSLFWLYIIQACTVSLQGFLNCMVYAWRRTHFREAVLGENTPLIVHGDAAFFDESLRSSF